VLGQLVQPLGRQGSGLPSGYKSCSYIVDGDWHDASHVNNANGVPVVLEFDNFSGQKYLLDDIRRLVRASTVHAHTHTK
jgi:hypothetical protein